MGRTRKDRHIEIIKAACFESMSGLQVVQFHTAQKMPKVLRGVPDLYLQRHGISWWIEIKPRYANYMRDQMSDLQWTWFHDRYVSDAFGPRVRYGIAQDADEIHKILGLATQDFVYMENYHWNRYDNWRK
jgi:hypothetical protein